MQEQQKNEILHQCFIKCCTSTSIRIILVLIKYLHLNRTYRHVLWLGNAANINCYNHVPVNLYQC